MALRMNPTASAPPVLNRSNSEPTGSTCPRPVLTRSKSSPAALGSSAPSESSATPEPSGVFGRFKVTCEKVSSRLKSAAKSFHQGLIVVPFEATCLLAKKANKVLWTGIGAVRQGFIETGKYAKSGMYGAAFGCLGGMAVGALAGALTGYALGSVGTPIVGVGTAGLFAIAGAGIGAMTFSAGGSLFATLKQYRSSWVAKSHEQIAQNQAQEVRINELSKKLEAMGAEQRS